MLSLTAVATGLLEHRESRHVSRDMGVGSVRSLAPAGVRRGSCPPDRGSPVTSVGSTPCSSKGAWHPKSIRSDSSVEETEEPTWNLPLGRIVSKAPGLANVGRTSTPELFSCAWTSDKVPRPGSVAGARYEAKPNARRRGVDAVGAAPRRQPATRRAASNGRRSDSCSNAVGNTDSEPRRANSGAAAGLGRSRQAPRGRARRGPRLRHRSPRARQ